MKIVVDENIPLADEFFADFGELHKVSGRLLTQAHLQDADALLVRSVTQVNEALLKDTRVGFVGSATIGEDHLDTAYLDNAGIQYSTAPGCNARAVVEYVAAALLELEVRQGWTLADKTLGIVGLGNVGSRLQETFRAWGLQTMACDPPLADQAQPGLVSFGDVLQADIVSLHTPLTRDGKYPTYHMMAAEQLGWLKPEAVLINASRGAVVSNEALKQVLLDRPDLSVVLDVWEGEPFIDVELAQRVEIATPHIAGYSYDGKVKGTEMLYQAFCQHLGVRPDKQLEELIPGAVQHLIDLNEGAAVNNCRELVQKVYRIEEDDINLRSSLQHPKDHRIAAFDQLRKHYRLRREFSKVKLRGVDEFLKRIDRAELKKIQALGFELPPSA